METMQAGTVHRFAGFVLDERDGVLSRPDGTEARLRPKAVSALCALVERQEQPVSRDALMRIVWPGICVTDDSITQCIAEIRRAMERMVGT